MKPLLIAVSILIAASAAAQETQPKHAAPETVVSLDASLKSALKRKYPGFRLATKSDYLDFLNGSMVPPLPGHQWSYGALKADFNGDGLQDYTLIMRHRSFFRWLTALKRGDFYDIKDFGPAAVLEEDDPPLKSQKQAYLLLTIGPAAGLKQDTVPLNPFPYIHLIGDGECIEAYWKNGVWNKNGFVD
jgi:hypothetical protein